MACDCIRRVNDGLAAFNAHVAIGFTAPGGEPQAVIETHQHGATEGEAYQLVAGYCPFCGVPYLEDPAIGVTGGGEVSNHVH